MKYSILYKQGEREVPSDITYDLSIDRCVANISPDPRKNEYFCRVVSTPLTCEEDISYRREILKDFIETQGLLAEAKTLFNRYDKLKGDWLELKGNPDSLGTDKGSEAMLDYIYSSLKVTALFPKTILSFYQSIVDTLGAFELNSQGLRTLRDYAGEMLNNKSLNEIADIAAQFMYNTPEDYDFETVCRIGDSFEFIDAEICSVVKREKKRTNLLSILSKKKKIEGIEENVSETAREDALSVLGEALYVIDKQLCEITDSVYATFYGISRELDFYEVACRYVEFLTSCGKPWCYPDLGASGIGCTELYDLLLLTEAKTEVYPNNAEFDSYMGVLIRGKNNTGKTTFLRSVATAQLLAQAGLPVPAAKAELPIFGGLYTHFSSAEEEFSAGDTAGRFEGEVKAIAAIMDSVGDNSLVILNETFQTTAYDEGTAAMGNILRALMSLNCRFIFVTHLTELFELFGEDILKLETENGDIPFSIGASCPTK